MSRSVGQLADLALEPINLFLAQCLLVFRPGLEMPLKN
jgi:hypothetical protein